MKVGLSHLAPHSALWWVRSSGSAALVLQLWFCSSGSAATLEPPWSCCWGRSLFGSGAGFYWSQLPPAGQLHTLRRWMNRNYSLSSANNPCPSLWKSSKSGCAFLPEGYSSNVSICSFKGIWGFKQVTSGKLSVGTRGNIHQRNTHLNLLHSGINWVWFIKHQFPTKVAWLHLTSVLSAAAKREGTQHFPSSHSGEEIWNPEALTLAQVQGDWRGAGSDCW